MLVANQGYNGSAGKEKVGERGVDLTGRNKEMLFENTYDENQRIRAYVEEKLTQRVKNDGECVLVGILHGK